MAGGCDEVARSHRFDFGICINGIRGRYAIGAVAILLLTVVSGPVNAAEHGTASVYARKFQGKRTASGERFHIHAMTCAHRRHPFGTLLRVISGRRSIVCRCNDRGPFRRGRIIDLTPAGARALGFSGLVRVRLERI
jgi:rare lipoprotein A (peptidoglycan hydrolase)